MDATMDIHLKRGTVPYFKWRGGRPRWEPGPRLRDAGFTGRDLKDANGAWLPFVDAVAAAQALNGEVAAWRATGAKPKRAQPAPPAAITVAQCWEDYERRGMRDLRPRTAADYRNKGKALIAWAGDSPIAALTTPLMVEWWETLREEKSLAVANGCLAVASAFLSWCRLRGHVKTNPARELKLKRTAPRVVIWTDEELTAMVAVADAAGEHGLADAIVAALWTGQRQRDVLDLPRHIFDAGRISLSQAKTAGRVDMKMPQAVAARRAGAMERVRRSGIVAHTFVVDDRTGKTFNSWSFTHRFAMLRAAVAGRNEAHGKPIDTCFLEAARSVLETPIPSVAEKRFSDLRDTCVTRLYKADVPILKIAAITGHEPRSVHTVLRHYLAMGAADADAAIDALEARLADDGVIL